ncbi:MAG: hypothetical protein ACE5EK_07760, partial [Nitrospinales bacterium]
MVDRFIRRPGLFLLAVAVFLLTVSISTVNAEQVLVKGGHDHPKSHNAVDRPAWLDKFENQVEFEDMMSGLEGRQERLDKTFMQIMDRLQGKLKEHAVPASTGGAYHGSWAAHQLSQGFLLGPTEASDKVRKGAHCPSNAPVRSYDITAINVEITLNQWGDYFPGYMYVLTKNIAQVRKDEKTNAKARKDDLDPGAIITGLQGDTIQPLAIRANQGECVRFKVTNQVEDEDIGFQVNGSAMIISSSGLPVTAASPGAIIPAGGSQNFEWFIPLDEQEGSHLIQSHAGRDPSALGLIGAFMVEPRGS